MSVKRTTGASKKKPRARSTAEPRPYGDEPRPARRSVRERPTASGTDWPRLRVMTDAGAQRAAQRDPDNPPASAAWLAAGHLVQAVRKEPISLRVDADVLEWFRTSGPLYQSRMNDVLRAYVEFHTQRRKRLKGQPRER